MFWRKFLVFSASFQKKVALVHLAVELSDGPEFPCSKSGGTSIPKMPGVANLMRGVIVKALGVTR